MTKSFDSDDLFDRARREAKVFEAHQLIHAFVACSLDRIEATEITEDEAHNPYELVKNLMDRSSTSITKAFASFDDDDLELFDEFFSDFAHNSAIVAAVSIKLAEAMQTYRSHLEDN